MRPFPHRRGIGPRVSSYPYIILLVLLITTALVLSFFSLRASRRTLGSGDLFGTGEQGDRAGLWGTARGELSASGKTERISDWVGRGEVEKNWGMGIDGGIAKNSVRNDGIQLVKDAVDGLVDQQSDGMQSVSELVDAADSSPLSLILAQFQTRPVKLLVEPDYNNVIYDDEALKLRQAINNPPITALDLSIWLMTRPGHRKRVTDMIGGVSLDPQASRNYIQNFARSFASFDKSIIGPIKSTRDLIKEPPAPKSNCQMPDLVCVENYRGTPDAKSTQFSMENVVCSADWTPFHYCGNTRYDSDVVLPYVSWHDFGVMQKNSMEKSFLAAAFITNCAMPKRNHFVEYFTSQAPGQVHSYGNCVRSHPEPSFPELSRDAKKIRNLQTHFFSLAFENSETDYYVTEKLFVSFCAGSVPVVIGAPNVKFYAPDTGPFPYESKSLLHVVDFDNNPATVLEVMKAISKNKPAYEEMLAWKTTGYSDDYKALVDLGDVHSDCRACIAVADDLRKVVGITQFDVDGVMDTLDSAVDRFALFVRERGTYAFTRLGFPSRPKFLQLVESILKFVKVRPKNLWKDNDDLRPHREMNRVYAVYIARPVRRPVLADEDIEFLPEGCDLEVVFV